MFEPDFSKVRDAVMAYPEASMSIFVAGLLLGWGASWMLAHRELKVNRSIITAVNDATISAESRRHIIAHSLPHKGRLKLLVQSLAILVSIAFIASGLVIFLKMPSAADITNELKGQNNWFYLRADTENPFKIPGPDVPLRAVNPTTGRVENVRLWISKYEDNRTGPKYLSDGFGTWVSIIGNADELIGLSIKPGKYWIEINTYKFTLESLEITENNGVLTQKITVIRDGNTFDPTMPQAESTPKKSMVVPSMPLASTDRHAEGSDDAAVQPMRGTTYV
jgi:hypothetical protein